MVATFAANVPVIPAGHADAASATAALGVTVIVEVALEPATAVAADALKEKFTVSATVVVAVSAPLVPATVSE